MIKNITDNIFLIGTNIEVYDKKDYGQHFFIGTSVEVNDKKYYAQYA